MHTGIVLYDIHITLQKCGWGILGISRYGLLVVKDVLFCYLQKWRMPNTSNCIDWRGPFTSLLYSGCIPKISSKVYICDCKSRSMFLVQHNQASGTNGFAAQFAFQQKPSHPDLVLEVATVRTPFWVASMIFRLHSSHSIWQRQTSLWNWKIIHCQTVRWPVAMGCSSNFWSARLVMQSPHFQ